MLKLRVAVGIAGTFTRLPIGLTAVFQLTQQLAYELLAGLEPLPVSAVTMFRWLRLTQRSGDSGSPRIASSIKVSSAASRVGCRITAFLRPPPGRLIRRP